MSCFRMGRVVTKQFTKDTHSLFYLSNQALLNNSFRKDTMPHQASEASSTTELRPTFTIVVVYIEIPLTHVTEQFSSLFLYCSRLENF